MLVREANREYPDQTASSGIYKILVRIANRDDPDQTASEEAV